MSKYYDEIWSLIEKLDDINARLSDMLDAECDRHARPHLQAAVDHIEDAVEELERKGFRAAIMDAMDACAKKSREMSREAD